MRLAVVAHNLHAGGGRSVGVNLCRALPDVEEVDEALLVVPKGSDYAAAGDLVGVELVQVDVRSLVSRLRFDLRRLAGVVADFQPDWVLSLGNVPISRGDFQQALLLHDPYLLASRLVDVTRGVPLSMKAKKALLRRRLARSGADLDLVFCQTHAAADAIRRVYPSVRQTFVVPNVLSRGLDTARGHTIRVSPRQSRSFSMLTVSRYYPHKNFEAVVRAYETCPDLMAGVHWTITVHESHGRGARTLLRRIRSSRLEGSIHNIGPIEQSEVAGRYRESDAVILPSFLESFSANYIEAMHFGKPLLVSDRDFAREVCGDAALFFDPQDPLSIAKAIGRVRDQPDLVASLVGAGHRRMKAFPTSWDIAASAMVREMEAVSPGAS